MYHGPILDNHFHVQETGRFLEAVRAFCAAGGTHLTLIPIPGTTLKTTRAEWRAFFEAHLRICDRVARETPAKVLAALGPYPVEFVYDAQKRGVGPARDAFRAGYDAAHDLLRDHRAVAMGEVGRPHFEVPPEIWSASNELLQYGLERCREADAAAILHTEHATPQVFADLAGIARAARFPLERLVKHYAPPLVRPEENHGLWPSIIASKSQTQAAIGQGPRFLMETDYIDDLARPDVVLPPHAVPKRTKALSQQGIPDETLLTIHARNPEAIYRVNVTLEPGRPSDR